MNHSYTSTGERITESVVKYRLTTMYQDIAKDYCFSHVSCEGCGQPATCHAHIIAKARCKQIRKAELIYDRNNIFYSCYQCNGFIENPKGEGWKALKNIDKCLMFIEQHDPELYAKFTVTI
jgi:ribosomal protein S27E